MGSSHGDEWTGPCLGGHSFSQAQADLGVNVETTLLGLNVVFQSGTSLAQTHQSFLGLLKFHLQYADCLTQLLDFLLQSARQRQHARLTHTVLKASRSAGNKKNEQRTGENIYGKLDILKIQAAHKPTHEPIYPVRHLLLKA